MGMKEARRLFPLLGVDGVVRLFALELGSDEPDLALLSIVLGYVEHQLTVAAAARAAATAAAAPPPGEAVEEEREEEEEEAACSFPPVPWQPVEALRCRFVSHVLGTVDLTQFRRGAGGGSGRELVNKVSDVVWGTLHRSYNKDRAHIHSLYSYLTGFEKPVNFSGAKLDAFGVAFAVSAACQALGLRDVHLALSEDHAWLAFGPVGEETVEVTWHGKGNEDKRGQTVDAGVAEKMWLYLNGAYLRCTRKMEVACMVAAINPSIDSHTDSLELCQLQQKLLWLLYDLGHLDRYPMALGTLADLEDMEATPGRPEPLALYQQAIGTAQKFYRNQHVYPYLYLASFHQRHRHLRSALQAWGEAASVVQTYNYNREDEEIYKEFFDIANDVIPSLLKEMASSEEEVEAEGSEGKDGAVGAAGKATGLHDPWAFAHLLRFYDGICKWEEGSTTPVLHVGWATFLVQSVSRFDSKARQLVTVESQDPESDSDESQEEAGAREDGVRAAGGKKGAATAAAATASAASARGGRDEAAASRRVSRQNSGDAAPPAPSEDGDRAATCHQQLPPPVPTATGNPGLALLSEKMKGMKELFVSAKLNTSAIKLQLTAQSQVQMGKRAKPAGGGGAGDYASPAAGKRQRKLVS
ncbi:menin [Petromyzon marinus]|uniref:Menin n=2 Tax=Petromyzon marinus TaxID=7757 RepID=A0AAJ7UDS2_PETMA|nr:menin [Petromyzon marinus]